MPNLWLLFNEWRDSLIKESSNSGRLEPKFFEVQLFILHLKFSHPVMIKVYPFKASYDYYGSEDVTAIAEQALLYDQPSVKLIFVSCAQKNRIIYRSDEVHEREIIFQNFFSGKQPIKNKHYFC